MKTILLVVLVCGCEPDSITLKACAEACAPYGMKSFRERTGEFGAMPPTCVCRSPEEKEDAGPR